MPFFQKRDYPLLVIPPAVIAIDTTLKFLVLWFFKNTPFPESQPIPVLGDLVRITFVRSYGNFLQIIGESGPQSLSYAIIGVLVVTVLVLIYFYANVSKLFIRSARQPAKAFLLAIFGGDISNNLLDRAIRGYVVSYIDFGVGERRFYTFNFADICIITSAFALIVLILFYENREDKENKKI